MTWNSCSGSHASGHPAKVFFFQTTIVFFPSFFKYHVVFLDQLEDYIGEDDMIDMNEVNVL